MRHAAHLLIHLCTLPGYVVVFAMFGAVEWWESGKRLKRWL